MSSIEKVDLSIEKIIENLTEEFGRTGFLSAPSDERKNEIIETIAKLRASMVTHCNCKK